MSLGHQFIDTVQARRLQSGATPAQRDAAMATLVLIVRHLGWQSYAGEQAAADLAEMRGVAKPHISSTLGLLERIGAISRVKRGVAVWPYLIIYEVDASVDASADVRGSSASGTAHAIERCDRYKREDRGQSMTRVH